MKNITYDETQWKLVPVKLTEERTETKNEWYLAIDRASIAAGLDSVDINENPNFALHNLVVQEIHLALGATVSDAVEELIGLVRDDAKEKPELLYSVKPGEEFSDKDFDAANEDEPFCYYDMRDQKFIAAGNSMVGVFAKFKSDESFKIPLYTKPQRDLTEDLENSIEQRSKIQKSYDELGFKYQTALQTNNILTSELKKLKDMRVMFREFINIGTDNDVMIKAMCFDEIRKIFEGK